MPGLSRRFKQLEKELIALGEEAMLLDELDGFIAGLLVCPDLIKPGEWLSVVWNRGGDDQEPAFDDIDHANRVLALVMEYYNNIARTLMERPERYGPLLSFDKRNGDVLWELWIEGFEKAIALRPEAWKNFLDADTDTAAAMRGMFGLVAIANRNQPVPEDEGDAFHAKVPDKIARWVITLNEWRFATYRSGQNIGLGPNPFAAPAKKVGRNDPLFLRVREEIQEVLRTELNA